MGYDIDGKPIGAFKRMQEWDDYLLEDAKKAVKKFTPQQREKARKFRERLNREGLSRASKEQIKSIMEINRQLGYPIPDKYKDY